MRSNVVAVHIFAAARRVASRSATIACCNYESSCRLVIWIIQRLISSNDLRNKILIMLAFKELKKEQNSIKISIQISWILQKIEDQVFASNLNIFSSET